MFLKTFPVLLFLAIGCCLSGQTLKLEWAAEYPEVSNGYPGVIDERLFVDGEGNVHVCERGADPFSFLFLKYDSLGNLLWDAEHDGFFIGSLSGCALGGTGLFAGGTVADQPGTGVARAILVSYDENGGERYIKPIYDPQYFSSSLNDVEMGADGYVYVFGSVCPFPCDSLGAETFFYVAKIDPFDGGGVWKKYWRQGTAVAGKVTGDRIRAFGNTYIFGPSDTAYVHCLYEMDTDGNVLDSAFF